MKRKDFLKGTGLVGLGLVLPKTNLSGNTTKKSTLVDCTLIPTETAGPFSVRPYRKFRFSKTGCSRR